MRGKSSHGILEGRNNGSVLPSGSLGQALVEPLPWYGSAIQRRRWVPWAPWSVIPCPWVREWAGRSTGGIRRQEEAGSRGSVPEAGPKSTALSLGALRRIHSPIQEVNPSGSRRVRVKIPPRGKAQFGALSCSRPEVMPPDEAGRIGSVFEVSGNPWDVDLLEAPEEHHKPHGLVGA